MKQRRKSSKKFISFYEFETENLLWIIGNYIKLSS